jgi:hypothetical protein
MATPIPHDLFVDARFGQLTLRGKTFPVGPQTEIFKKPTGTGPIVLNQPGLVLDGYDISGRDVLLTADNCVVRNCIGDAAGLHTIWQQGQAKGGIVEFNLLDSRKGTRKSGNNGDLVMSDNNAITIRNNIFLDSPVDCLNLAAGLIEHNVIDRAQFSAGAHSDAVSVHRTTSPVVIRENYINFILHTAGVGTNACIKLVGHFGPVVDVQVVDNILIGGGYNSYAGPAAPANTTFDKVSILRNLMGLTEYGDKQTQFIMPGNHGTNFVMDSTNILFSSAPGDVVSFKKMTGPVVTPPVVTPPPVVEPPPVTPEVTFTPQEITFLKQWVQWIKAQ